MASSQRLKAAFSRLSSIAGSKVSNSSSQREFATIGSDYLTIMVKTASGYWRYANFHYDMICTTTTPMMFPLSEEDNLIEIWKRVVLDNAIPWDESVDVSSMKVVRYRLDLNDITSDALGDEKDELLTRSAMSRLSDQEARMLGLEGLKARQKITENPTMDSSDKNLIQLLRSRQLEQNFEHGFRP